MKIHSVQFSLSSVISSISLSLSLSLCSSFSPHQAYYCLLFTEKLVGTKMYYTECCYMLCCRSSSNATNNNTTRKPFLENKYPIFLHFFLMDGFSKIYFVCFKLHVKQNKLKCNYTSNY
jgi:hypothetical protein